MLDGTLLRLLVMASATLLGSIGVFFLVMSLQHPAVGPHALLFLSAACGIILYVPK